MASDSDGDSPWTRPSTLLAIAFLVFAVVAGSIVLLRSRHTAPAAAAQPAISVSTAPPTSTQPRPGSPSATAPLPNQTVPDTAPQATWITVATLALPTSPTYGPKVNDGTVMAGYQHSPTGALFAVADNRVRFSLVPNWKAATLSAVADNPGRAAFIRNRTPYGVLAAPTPGTFTQIAGYNFVSYKSDQAVIQVLSQAVDGSYTTLVTTAVWKENDWKISLSPSGDNPPVATAPSASGYVAWKAGS